MVGEGWALHTLPGLPSRQASLAGVHGNGQKEAVMESGFGGVPESNGSEGADQSGEFTGRYLVVFSDEVQGDARKVADTVRSLSGVSEVAFTADFKEGAVDPETVEDAGSTYFDTIGVAVVSGDPSEGARMSAFAEADSRILAIEPERILYAIDDQGALSLEYVRGYRDGLNNLYEQLFSDSESPSNGAAIAAAFNDNQGSTWGLQATRAASSARTGARVRLAVLDTGFALDHPDFKGRPVVSRSFVTGQSVQDGHGHGTHCVGTACGPKVPAAGVRRYGVATKADIVVAKVLNNQGSGSDSNILAGIDWAIRGQARVISMSLGADVKQTSTAYEMVGRRALQAGSLIVAAAGNNASRSTGNVGFVGIPANSPSIMAVGAVDSNLRIATFSARSNPVIGGKVDIAGPGVSVFSSWTLPTRYKSIPGTSMATPHVAGVAALISESTGARGSQLWTKVVQSVRPLNVPSVDVGAGLVQAPQ
jgi:subtilisin